MATALTGYSPWSADDVLAATLEGIAAPGDWIVASDDTIASAPVGARPYFFTADGCHGPDFFDVVRRAQLAWRWNIRAVRSLAALGHTIGTDTLHPDVYRMPSASIVRFSGGQVSTTTSEWWTGVFADRPSDPCQALRAAMSELDGDLLIPLSAGFDSRLLLAVALDCGMKPLTATMGFARTEDRVVAERVAAVAGVEHSSVELDTTTYLDAGPEVTRLTGGTKLAANWHTYLFAHAVGHPGTLVVGANGEFARSFYFDRGRLAAVAQRLPRQAAHGFLATKVIRRGSRFGTLGRPHTFVTVARHAAALTHGPRSAMDTFDLFYATQRVRHFIGNGLALFGSASTTMSPFLDHRFVTAAAALRRDQKLGSTFHRETIGRLSPALMSVPIGGHGGPSYSPWKVVAASEEARDLVVNSSELDQFADRAQRETAWSTHDLNLMDLLVTLHFAARAAASVSCAPVARS